MGEMADLAIEQMAEIESYDYHQSRLRRSINVGEMADLAIERFIAPRYEYSLAKHLEDVARQEAQTLDDDTKEQLKTLPKPNMTIKRNE